MRQGKNTSNVYDYERCHFKCYFALVLSIILQIIDEAPIIPLRQGYWGFLYEAVATSDHS